MTTRYVALWIPNWEFSSLVVSVPPGAPAAVVHRKRIQKATPAALRLGVSAGMPLVMAQHLVPNLIVIPPDDDRDNAAFEAVLEVFDQLAAGVMAVRPGLAFAPARSAARWNGGEHLLAEELVEQVTTQTGVECLVGIADTLSGALLAARCGQIVPSEQAEEFLDAQPLRSLIADLPPKAKRSIGEDLKVMQTLGITTVGGLRQLGEGPVLTRFGRSGEILLQLLRGSGPLLQNYQRSSLPVEASIELDPPATISEHAAVAIRRVATDLADRLTQRDLFSSTVRVTLERVDHRKTERTWTLLEATSSTQVSKRITWQLKAMSDAITLANTELEGESEEGSALKCIHLSALHPAPRPDTEPLWGGSQNLRKASIAVEEVQATLGQDSAVVPRIHGGFDPRTRISFLPWGNEAEEYPPLLSPWEGRVSETPAVLFAQPKAALVMGELEDGTTGTLRVNERGILNGIPSHLILREDHSELPAGDYPLDFVKGIWVIRGRWWKNSGWAHRPRCYLRVARRAGPDLLLVQRARNWWVEGIYPTAAIPRMGSITPGNPQT